MSLLALMVNRYRKILLLCIVVFAFAIRVYVVQSNPPSLSWDEVSIGYNAYSVLKTGKDEHGRMFPIDTFIAYGDYKPPIAVYLTIPSIALFGLNEFSVRFPVVIFGTLTVFLTYLLGVSLLTSYKHRIEFSLLSSFVLAISPWHIQLSRAGYESTIALFWIVLGVVLAVRAKLEAKYLGICWIPFVVAFYTFNSSRYAGPLIVCALCCYLWPTLVKQVRKTIIGIVLAVLLLLPIVPHLFSPQAQLRFAEVNIFSDISIIEKSNARIAADGNTWWSKIIHNRRWYYFRSFVSHYLDHFEPRFLFIRGDGNPKFSTQETGQLYLFEAIFLITGVFFLSKLYPKQSLLLLSWLLLSIVPAATARETPHALRILNSLPTWQLFIAFGILEIALRIKKKYFFSIVLGSLYFFSFLYFIHNYVVYYPKEYSGEWQWGYREAIQFIDSYKQNYSAVVITDSIGRPYMYTLFYTKYDPKKYREQKKSFFDAAGFYHVSSFDKYLFVKGKPDQWEKGVVYILDPHNVPSNATILSTINLLNGKPVLTIFII